MAARVSKAAYRIPSKHLSSTLLFIFCTCSRKLGLGSATLPNLDDDDGPMLKGWALPLLRVS